LGLKDTKQGEPTTMADTGEPTCGGP